MDLDMVQLAFLDQEVLDVYSSLIDAIVWLGYISGHFASLFLPFD